MAQDPARFIVASGIKVKPVYCVRVYSFAKTVQKALMYAYYCEILPIIELTYSSQAVNEKLCRGL